MNISKKSAALGENVTVNTKPNDGYEVDTVTVTGSVKFDKSRNPIKSLSVIKIENGSPKLQEKINP